jgi:hypothetical protein
MWNKSVPIQRGPHIGFPKLFRPLILDFYTTLESARKIENGYRTIKWKYQIKISHRYFPAISKFKGKYTTLQKTSKYAVFASFLDDLNAKKTDDK